MPSAEGRQGERSGVGAREARLGRALEVLLGIACGAAVLLFVWGFVHRAGYPYDILPDEGLMTLYTERLLSGQSPYATDRGFPYLYTTSHRSRTWSSPLLSRSSVPS